MCLFFLYNRYSEYEIGNTKYGNTGEKSGVENRKCENAKEKDLGWDGFCGDWKGLEGLEGGFALVFAFWGGEREKGGGLEKMERRERIGKKEKEKLGEGEGHFTLWNQVYIFVGYHTSRIWKGFFEQLGLGGERREKEGREKRR